MSHRLFDLALVVPGLFASAPLVLASAVLVKLSSPGRAFYAQTRIGRGMRPFRLYKLRTMVDGADHVGAHVTGAHDPRVTAIGALLRRCKIDELPQLWNVVRGDMSVIGPRPEAERYVSTYPPEWRRVFGVRPGLTDRASLVFRNEERLLALAADRERAYLDTILPAKVALQIASIESQSLLGDLRIVVQTFAAVLGVMPAFARQREREIADRLSSN